MRWFHLPKVGKGSTSSMSQNVSGVQLPLAQGINQTSSKPSLLPSFNTTKSSLLSNVLSFGVALSLPSLCTLPAWGISSLTAQPPATAPTTPFSQAKNLPKGLENGKIRPCPSINPGCVSTNPQSSSFSFPWIIPQNSLQDAVKDLEDAIVVTQKNVKIQAIDDTPNGKYLQVEVDGGFGRDVMEFLVKEDTVGYRAMATKVTYIYPFITSFGDSKGQQERMQRILQRLGWYTTTLDFME